MVLLHGHPSPSFAPYSHRFPLAQYILMYFFFAFVGDWETSTHVGGAYSTAVAGRTLEFAAALPRWSA